MVSSLSSAITHVRAEEFSDIRTYNAPLVVREVMGFGLTPEQAMSGPIAALLEAGFKASVRMVTDQLGFRAEPRIRSTQEVAVAVTGTDELVVPMEPGTVAARRFRWEAIVDDRPVVTAAVNWLALTKVVVSAVAVVDAEPGTVSWFAGEIAPPST